MRRWRWIAYLSVLTWMLSGLSGCSWPGLRRGGRGGLDPEKAAQAKAIGDRAQAALDAGDLASAEAELARLTALTPASPEAFQRRGAVLQLQGRNSEAEGCFLKAVELDPDFVAALTGLGRTEAALGKLDSAFKHLETAVEIEPHDANAQLASAQVLESLGRPDDALAAYFRTLEADPFQVEASRRIAAIQIGRDEADLALVRLDQTIESSPSDAEALYLRGRAHLVLGHFTQAVADLRGASQRLADRPEVHMALARALAADRQPVDALRAVEAVLRLTPDDAEARTLGDSLRR